MACEFPVAVWQSFCELLYSYFTLLFYFILLCCLKRFRSGLKRDLPSVFHKSSLLTGQLTGMSEVDINESGRQSPYSFIHHRLHTELTMKQATVNLSKRFPVRCKVNSKIDISMSNMKAAMKHSSTLSTRS